jgi:hypothetical protein
MTLDPTLWEALQQHGVTVAHLDMLLKLLATQRNGSWSWHFVHGHLSQADLRLVCPARSADVGTVAEVLGEGNALLR